MKITTYTKEVRESTHIFRDRFVVCHCDLCSTTHEYAGKPTDAHANVKRVGWTIGGTGIARCKECSQRHAAIVQGAMGSVNP